jgi:type VI protein secretion system component Hcp
MADAILVMKLDGPNGTVAGECHMERFKDWIVLESWRWSINSGEDDVRPGAISITKECDRASPTMMQLLDTQKPCPRVEIMLWEGSEDSNLELSIVLTNVHLLNLRVTLKNEEKGGSVDESWDIEYSKIQFKYYSPEADAADVTAARFVEAEFLAHADGATANADAAKQKEFVAYFGKLNANERERLLKDLTVLHDNDGKDPRRKGDEPQDAKRMLKHPPEANSVRG